jgi:hypothetical protein
MLTEKACGAQQIRDLAHDSGFAVFAAVDLLFFGLGCWDLRTKVPGGGAALVANVRIVESAFGATGV